VSCNAGPRLDRLPISSFHRRILGLIGAGMFLDAFEVYMASGVLGALVEAGWSTVEKNALFVSVTFIGMVLGAWLAGVTGDRFGRRFSYQLNLVLFGGASLAAAFASNMEILTGLRFIMGIGLGAEIVVGYATLGEFLPPADRGRWVALLSVLANSALFVSSILSWWIIPRFGWRYLFAIVGVGALIIWLLRKSMPESPRWLEARGRHEEAERILVDIEAKARERGPLPPPRAAAPVQHADASFMVLFSAPLRSRTLVGMLLYVVVGFGLYGFLAWLPTFFVKQGYSIASTFAWTTAMSAGGPVGALVGMWLADRIGRRTGVIAATLSAALFSAVYPFVGDGWLLMAIGFSLVGSLYVMIAIGYALYVPELFPTAYRLRGTGLCATAGRLTTSLVQFPIVALFGWRGVGGVVALLVVLLLFQAVVFQLFAIETKDKTLEEIASIG